MDEKEIINEEQKSEETEETFTKAQLDELMEKERKGWEEKLKEAEKLSKMDSQQKATYELQREREALSEREVAVSKRELMADAAEKLSAYKLPKSLIKCVNFSSEEECEQSIEGLKSAFSEAVSKAVNDRVKGNAPGFSANGGNDAFLDGLFR